MTHIVPSHFDGAEAVDFFRPSTSVLETCFQCLHVAFDHQSHRILSAPAFDQLPLESSLTHPLRRFVSFGLLCALSLPRQRRESIDYFSSASRRIVHSRRSLPLTRLISVFCRNSRLHRRFIDSCLVLITIIIVVCFSLQSECSLQRLESDNARVAVLNMNRPEAKNAIGMLKIERRSRR